jgi:putative membrane protein
MSEIDRTRLANERTFLAWWRTGVAALAAGLAAARLVPQLADSPHHWPYTSLGAVLVGLGTLCLGYAQWRRVTVERAVLAGNDSDPARLVPTLLAVVGVIAGLGLLALIVSGG